MSDDFGAEFSEWTGKFIGLIFGSSYKDFLAEQWSLGEPGTVLCQVGYGADDHDNWRSHLGRWGEMLSDLVECAEDGLLVGEAAAAEDCCGCTGWLAGIEQGFGPNADGCDAHVDHEGSGKVGQRLPVEGRFGFSGFFVAGDQCDCGCESAVGDGDAGKGTGGKCGGDTGNDFERQACGANGIDFFGRAGEDGWVASFEPDDDLAGLSVLQDFFVDFVLSPDAGAAMFADADVLGVGSVLEDRFVAESVIEDDIGAAEDLGTTQSQKAGIAWSSTDQVDEGWGKPAGKPGFGLLGVIRHGIWVSAFDRGGDRENQRRG